jgi:hypothetical protein
MSYDFSSVDRSVELIETKQTEREKEIQRSIQQFSEWLTKQSPPYNRSFSCDNKFAGRIWQIMEKKYGSCFFIEEGYGGGDVSYCVNIALLMERSKKQ